MYADDLVLISPSSAGLSQLLRECEKFGTRHDVKYNLPESTPLNRYAPSVVEQITCIFGVNRANCDTSTKVGIGHLYGH